MHQGNWLMTRAIILSSSIVLLAQNPPAKQEIHPPNWALGKWTNLTENDSRKFITFIITSSSVSYSQGTNPGLKDFAQEHKGWSFTEHESATLYRIEFKSKKQTEFLEFRLSHRNPKIISSTMVMTFYFGGTSIPANVRPDGGELLQIVK